jgi:hypothetical protein
MEDGEHPELDFDPLDVTKIWPPEKFPIVPIGRMVLDRNPSNYFTEVEQVAFGTGVSLQQGADPHVNYEPSSRVAPIEAKPAGKPHQPVDERLRPGRRAVPVLQRRGARRPGRQPGLRALEVRSRQSGAHGLALPAVRSGLWAARR